MADHTAMTDDIAILYVGGLPRSGSTLTDLILDQLPDHVSVGELYYLFRNGLLLDNLCGCGERFSACPFWQAVGEAAYGGWASLSADAVLRLQSRVDRTTAIPAIVGPVKTQAFQRDLTEYTGILRALYRGIREVSGQRVVIDSSKRPSMAYLLARMPDVSLTCAHVVRDPRGVAYSFDKVVPLRAASDAGAHMPRSRPSKVGRRWVTVNALIHGLRHMGVPTLTVRYEELAADPVRVLGRIAALEGLSADDIDPSFLTRAGLRVSRAHLVAGSRIRLLDGVLPIVTDDEWRRSMPAGKRRLVSSMTVLSRARYGYLR
jgi:hypothetical protein